MIRRGDIVRLVGTEGEADFYEALVGRLGVAQEDVSRHAHPDNIVECRHLNNIRDILYPFLRNLAPAPGCEEELAAQRMIDELSR
jgi:hypothetical protein